MSLGHSVQSKEFSISDIVRSLVEEGKKENAVALASPTHEW